MSTSSLAARGELTGLEIDRPTPEQVRQVGREFVSFSIDRFGTPDFEAHTLSRREDFLDIYRSQPHPRWCGEPVPAREFADSVAGKRPLSAASPLTSWLARLTRTHIAEAWALRYHMKRFRFSDGAKQGRAPSPLDLMTLQELYHVPIFVELVRLFDLELAFPAPPRSLQVLIRAAARTVSPQKSSVATAIAEIIGVLATNRLRIECDELLSSDPATLECARALLDEVFTDEVGHMMFAVNTLSLRQRQLLRPALPAAVAALGRTYYRGYADGTRVVRDGCKHLSLDLFPAEIVAHAFVPSQLSRTRRTNEAR